MKRSTGLRNYMLATGSFKQAIEGSVLSIYAGPVPPTADAPITGATLLCTISAEGTGAGVTLNTSASGGTISKNPSEVWTGEVIASGTATFFRMQQPSDASGESTTAVRLQGTVGLIDADLQLSSVNLVLGDARRINFFVGSISAG